MYAVIHFPFSKNEAGGEIGRDELHRLANSFSPLFEIIDARTVAIDIRGLDLLFPGGNDEIVGALERECAAGGRRANIVIAASLAQGVMAALCLPGTTVFGADDPESADRLARLPLAKAGLPENYLAVFGEWGVRTVGELLALPEGDLISRLGGELEPFLRNLAGSLPRPLLAEQLRQEFTRRVDPQDPLEDLSMCLALVEQKLAELLGELSRYALAAGSVIVTADGDEPREVRLRLPVPSANLRFLMKLLELEFEKTESGLVRGLTVAVLPEAPRRVQPSFWQPSFPDDERLELTLAKLRNLLGPENVGRPLMLDSYHTKHFIVDTETRPAGGEPLDEPPESPPVVVFRHFPAPRPVRIERSREAVFYFEDDDVRRRLVTRFSGPWISSGGWWSEDGDEFGLGWARREADVELTGGRIYRVVEGIDGRCFVEGYYD